MPEVDVSVLRRQLSALLESYRPDEARVRAVMTRKGQAYLALEPLKPLPRQVYEIGVRAETVQLHRRQPRLKSTTFIDWSDAARKHIAQEGVFEALLVREKEILEGMTSNFFYVGQAARLPHVGTARDNILLGITRETVIEIVRGLGLEIKYEPMKTNQLEAIEEAFITSSTRGIVPVIQIDDITIGQGRPGSITKQLSAVYDTYVIENAEKVL
jgi:branched-chain amino acid aminotransferase